VQRVRGGIAIVTGQRHPPPRGSKPVAGGQPREAQQDQHRSRTKGLALDLMDLIAANPQGTGTPSNLTTPA